RQTSRRRIKMQMNKVIRDHINLKYIDRVEYRWIKQPGQLIDCLIRFYPGEAARESIKRISRAEKQIPGLMEAKPTKPRKKNNTDPEKFSDTLPSEQSDFNGGVAVQFLLPAPKRKIPPETIQALADRGVFDPLSILRTLSREQLERAEDTIDYWDSI